MISTTSTGSHPHVHPKSARGALELENGRMCMDSQKFLVPSLPVNSRPQNQTQSHESGGKRRERSIINGTAHPHETNYIGSHSNYAYLHQQQQSGVRRAYNQHNGHHASIGNHTQRANPGLSPHAHQQSPKKETVYHQHHNSGGSMNGEISQRSHHQMPTNPSNYHHLARSSMPVPCSSPSAASSASPKANSPATNGNHLNSQSQHNSYSPQLPNVSPHSHGELNLSSPLRFYSPGFPHPSHPVSFYAAAAAAAAAASHHHPLPYPHPLFGPPYSHSAAASSYLDNFHSTLLAHQQHQQQQEQHLKSALSPSPPSRLSNANFHPHASPLSSPNTSTPTFHAKHNESVSEGGRYNSSHHNNSHHSEHSLGNYGIMEHGRGISTQRHGSSANINGQQFASLLCSGLSKGGPLGLGSGTIDNSNRQHTSSGSHFCHKESSSSISIIPMNDEKNPNSISSKFWNIDSALTTAVAGKIKALSPAEKELKIEKGIHNHFPEVCDSMNSKQGAVLNGKEGSLKHRILTRSPDQTVNSPIRSKMSKTVFTFPTTTTDHHHHDTGGNIGRQQQQQLQMKEHSNAVVNGNPGAYHNMKLLNTRLIQSGSPSYPFPSPKKRCIGQVNYPSLSNSDLLPSPLTRATPSSAATTTTTDSAKYLSQNYKPSINLSSSQSLPTSPYLLPNKSAQNLSSPRTPIFFNNSPTGSIGLASKSMNGIPISPSHSYSTSSVSSKSVKSSPLPVEQMPVIHAFKKGSLIQLACGQLRPVEELRAEDFHCAAATMADSLRILHCKVVSIQSNSTEDRGDELFCKVTLAVGAQQHQVVMDTTPAQPFFVLGRGWASWSPEATEKILQLPCTPLNVGDVCITLTKMSRAKPGRNGGKAGSVPKSPTRKYKNNANSILSAAPRNESSTMYASKILKVSNGGGTTKSNNKTKATLPSSPSKVKFEQIPTTSTNKGTNNCPGSMLPPPSPLISTSHASSTKGLSLIPSKPVGPIELRSNDQDENISKHESPCPKKRRWSAPEVIPEDEKEDSNVPAHPKRPLSQSPITILP